MNSSYNPLGAHSAEQAPGRDLLASIYQNYVVLGVQIMWRIRNSSANHHGNELRAWGTPEKASGSTLNTFTKCRDSGYKSTYINSTETSSHMASLNRGISKMIKSRYIRPEKYMLGSGGDIIATIGTAAVGADPTQVVDYNIFMSHASDAPLVNAVTVDVEVWITQYVCYYELQTAVIDS